MRAFLCTFLVTIAKRMESDDGYSLVFVVSQLSCSVIPILVVVAAYFLFFRSFFFSAALKILSFTGKMKTIQIHFSTRPLFDPDILPFGI